MDDPQNLVTFGVLFSVAYAIRYLVLPLARVLLQPGRRCTPRRFLTVISLRRERRITAVLDFRQGALPEMRRPEDLRIDPVTSAFWGESV